MLLRYKLVSSRNLISVGLVAEWVNLALNVLKPHSAGEELMGLITRDGQGESRAKSY